MSVTNPHGHTATSIETDCAPLTNLEITPTTLADQSAFIGCHSLSRLTLPGAPKVSESLRKVLPQLYSALFWQTYHGADPVPKLTWPGPTTLAITGPCASRGCPGLPSCQSIAPARTTATGECACCCNSSGSLGSRSGSLSWKSELEPLLDLCIQRRVQDSGPQALLRSGRTTSTTRQPLIRDGRAS